MEIVLKAGKVYKYLFHDCLKIFLLVSTALKMHGSLKNDPFLVEKNKNST